MLLGPSGRLPVWMLRHSHWPPDGHLQDSTNLCQSQSAGALPGRRLAARLHGAESRDIQPGQVIAVRGCGPVGQFDIAGDFLLGTERVIEVDRFPYQPHMARENTGTETLNYEELDVLDA